MPQYESAHLRLTTRNLKLATALAASLAACILNLATVCAYAQTGFASLSGRVVDSSGAVIPKAEVIVTNVDTRAASKTGTNNDGIYNLPGIQPGRYLMRVEKQGFRSVDVTGLTLYTQDLVARNFTLEVGSASESVTVNANGVNINTTDASVSTVIDRDFVENMPLNGRSLQDLETLVPGVSLTQSQGVGNSGEITVNGQRTEENYFTVDGVSANVGTGTAGISGGTPAETALGTTQSMVSVDALQEFRATTSTYSAEYGRTPGGQFSFTTRSGTNQWQGSLFDYVRNEAFDANNWFNDATSPITPKEKERQNDFGGTLGGPIRIPRVYNGGDKTFFFFSYEGLRLWTPQGLSTSSVPDLCLRGADPATNCTGTNTPAPVALQPELNAFPLPNKGEDGLNDAQGLFQVSQSFPSTLDSISVRVDHNFSGKFKLFGRYANTPSSTSTYDLAQRQDTVINNQLVTLGLTNLITSTQANELRFNITQVHSNFIQSSTDLGGATQFDVSSLPGPNETSFPIADSYFQFELAYGGYPNFSIGETTSAQRQYNITDTYSWTLGRHSIKFGLDWRRLTTYVRPITLLEGAYFFSESAVLANNAGLGGQLVAASNAPSPVEPLYKNLSVFAQDEWKVTPRLSLSMGLRWDINPAPTNLTGISPFTLDQITNLNTAQLAPGGTPLWNTDWRGFAPRFGGAYQVHQKPGHETVLRAGFGMFYDMGNTLGSTGFQAIGYSTKAYFSEGSFPLTSAELVLPPISTAAPYDQEVVAFDRNLKLPYTLQWNVALEQALGSKQALTLSYVGSAGRRLLITYDVYPSSNPNFGAGGGDGAEITRNGAASDYDALQIQFQRTLSRGLQALASYTWSHSIDDATSNFNLSDLLERASSDFDIRHNVQAALTYDVPGEYRNPVLSGLLKHWALDGRLMVRSAPPVDVIANYNIDTITDASVQFHPNLVLGEALYLYGSQYPGGRIINYDAFNVPASGPGLDSEGDTPRNYARGFGAWQMNVAIRREFPIHERLHMQFRAEAFNLLNHTSFAGINNNWTSGPYNPQGMYGFGAATGTLNVNIGSNALYTIGSPRSLQLALKLLF